MPIRADRPKLPPAVRRRARHLHAVPGVYQPGDVWRMRGLLVGCIACRVLLLPLFVPFVLVGLECRRSSHPLATNGDGDFSIRRDGHWITQLGFAYLLQLLLHSVSRLLPPVCVGGPHVIGHCGFLPQHGLHPLDERQRQPQILHHQLADFS